MVAILGLDVDMVILLALIPFADSLLNLSVDHNLCGHVGFVESCRHHASKETVTPLRQASLAKLHDLY